MQEESRREQQACDRERSRSQSIKLTMIDHSAQLHQDFEQFLFNDTLSDLKIVVKKSFGPFDVGPEENTT